MNLKLKKTIIELIFWSHLVIVFIWFGLFFVPNSLWSNKTAFHFWFIVDITTIQFFWGLILYKYTKKVNIICPMTTLMQKLRGFPLKTKENIAHSFIVECLGRLNVKVSYKTINLLLLITVVLVSIQYYLLD